MHTLSYEIALSDDAYRDVAPPAPVTPPAPSPRSAVQKNSEEPQQSFASLRELGRSDGGEAECESGRIYLPKVRTHTRRRASHSTPLTQCTLNALTQYNAHVPDH